MKFKWGTLDFSFIIQKTKIIVGKDDPLRAAIESMMARIEHALNEPAGVPGDPVQDGPVSRRGCWELMIAESGEICILFIEIRRAEKISKANNNANNKPNSKASSKTADRADANAIKASLPPFSPRALEALAELASLPMS